MGILILRTSIAEALPSTDITPSLVASRTSGPAPLAVHFDATGTTAAGVSDPFRELGYYFVYGDSGAGTWAANGRSKNIDEGAPLGAHVFETPGTYTVKVGVLNPADSDFAQTSVTITVQDPDAVFSGTSTICLSMNSDHTGAPAGADLRSNVTSWPSIGSNQRILLHAGQDFSSLGTLIVSNAANRENVLISRYGSGDDPIVGTIQGDSFTLPSTTTFPTNITLANLQFQNLSTGVGYNNLTLFRLSNTDPMQGGTIMEFAGGIFWARDVTATAPQLAALQWPNGTFVVECDLGGSLSASNQYFMTGSGKHIVLMGNTFDTSSSHAVRIWQGHKAVFRHNYFDQQPAGHHIKFHSDGLDEWDDLVENSMNPASRLSVVADNYIDSNGGSLEGIPVGPGDAGRILLLEDMIVERNYFGFDGVNEVLLGGRRMTERGNTGAGYNAMTGYGNHRGGPETYEIPDGANGPYYTGGSNIATQAPT